jgi:hypothetical protein
MKTVLMTILSSVDFNVASTVVAEHEDQGWHCKELALD